MYGKKLSEMVRDTLYCPACKGASEEYFAGGYTCPTCGRKQSSFLREIAEAEAKPSNDLDLLTQEICAMKQHLVEARRALDTNSFAHCAWEIDAALKVGAGTTAYDEEKHGPRPTFKAPDTKAAHEMGAKGGPAEEAERIAFEAWMRGHCWALGATWTGSGYKSDSEHDGWPDPQAMRTRQMWAAWRDRAALTANVELRGGPLAERPA